MTSDKGTLVIIGGPTASGKTKAAVQLAQRLGTEDGYVIELSYPTCCNDYLCQGNRKRTLYFGGFGDDYRHTRFGDHGHTDRSDSMCRRSGSIDRLRCRCN